MATSGRTRAYRLYAGAISGTANAVASIQLPQNGVITAISWSGFADTGSFLVELANTSVTTATTNDTPGTSFDVFAIPGVADDISGANKLVAGLQIPVTAGDHLYLHALKPTGSGGVAAIAYCTVYITQ